MMKKTIQQQLVLQEVSWGTQGFIAGKEHELQN